METLSTSFAVVTEQSPIRVVIILLLITIPLYVTGRGFYYAYFHPLAKIPGPKSYAFSQVPLFYYLFKGTWHEQLKNLHDQYGPVVRYAYNDVSFTSTTALKTIYGHKRANEKTFEKDSDFYKTGRPQFNIINAPNEDHRRMRRLISHAFSEKALANQEHILKSYVDLFISKLTVKAKAGETIDIVSWYNFATFDLIGDLAFGQSFGCLDAGVYHPWVKMIFESVKVLVYKDIAIRLNLRSMIPLLAPASLQRSAEEHLELSTKTAMKRLENPDMEREDFTSYFLRYNDERGMSVPELADNANVLIIAGSETTATQLSGTTFQLLQNPAVYGKVVDEIRSSFQSEDDITITSVNHLTYMLAALSEGFRMYPPVPSNLPRAVPSGGDFVDGYFIPEHTTVSVAHWQAFQTERNFKNPQEYIPERWLDAPEYASDEKSVLQPFSFGPRNCVGKNLAYAEMRLLLARLLWNFDLELMPDSKNWDKQKVFTLWEKGSLNIKLTKVERKSD